MPVLHQNEDGSSYSLRMVRDDRAVVFDLRPEGAQILLNVYGVRVGGTVDPETLEKLVGLRLAALRPEPAPTPPPEPEPAPKAIEPAPAAAPAPAPPRPREATGPVRRSTAGPERPSDAVPKAPAPRPTTGSPESRPSPGRHQRRTRGREVALQVLYQVEQNPGLAAEEVEKFLRRRLAEDKVRAFARGLVDGVEAHRETIDALITEVAENWRLDRMAAIDRNILRLGAFEMLFDEAIPAKVAINEALELAKRYSTAQSSRFVNGILDRLLSGEAARKALARALVEAIDAPVDPSPTPPADEP